MATYHTITPMEYRHASFGERVGLEIVSAVLWPLGDDERMTVLLSVLSAQIADNIDEDQVDALIDSIRLRLKLSLHDEQENRHHVR